MKKIYLHYAWLLFLLISHVTYSQTQSNITTPNGSSVTAWIFSEMNASDRSYWDSYFSSPNRTQFSYYNDGYSSSHRFNCHGYAWSISENGPVRWIGAYVTTEEDIYMTDGSYVQVCSETYPGKVSWADGDHSAITTSVAGRWVSKWRYYPLMNHHKDDTPFGDDYRYYVSTNIAGSSNICNSSSNNAYSVQNISGASYSWSKSSNLTLSGSGNAITVTPVSGAIGAAWVEVYISTGCGTATRRKNITIDEPASVTGGTYTNAAPGFGQLSPAMNVICGYYIPCEITFYVQGTSALSNAYMSAASGSSPAWYAYSNTIGFDGFSYANQWCTFTAVVSNGCGTNSYDYTFYQYDCPGESARSSGEFKIYPNPANSIVHVEAVQEDAVTASKNKAPQGYSVKLFNDKGLLLKTLDNKTGSGKATFNTAFLPPGTYYVHITRNGKVVTRQLFIRR